MPDRELSTADVAQRLEITKTTARRFMRNARGKGAFQLNGRWRISQADFQNLIEELKNPGRERRKLRNTRAKLAPSIKGAPLYA